MEQLQDHEGRLNAATGPGAGRKAYAAPRLVEYGSAAKLTQQSGSPGAGSQRRAPNGAPAKMR